MPYNRLANKRALVTGAGSGIGRAISLALASEGANVTIVDVNEEAGNKVSNEVSSLAEKGAFVKCDVSKVSDIKHAVQEQIRLFGGIDILCNNAGVSRMKWVIDVTEEDYDWNMDIMAKGTFFMSQEVGKQMIKQGTGGRIINTASIAAFSGSDILSDYNAAKAAVVIHTISFARYLAKYNITVNAVCPGLVKTSMQEREIKWQAELYGQTVDEVKQGYLRHTALGKLEEPEDIAKVVVFLATEDAGFITGQRIVVDGGIMMHI